MEQEFNYFKDNILIEDKVKIKRYNDSNIIHFKRIIPKKESTFIVETCEKYFNWSYATTFGKVENHRKTKIIPLTNFFGFNHETFKAHSILGYWFKYCFNFFSNDYLFYINNELESHVKYYGDEGFQILKYEPGNYYHEHIDQGNDLKRKYSVIIYLNDDYQGGETYFPRQNISVKGKNGDILFFPSCYGYPHVAKEVISGVKYAAIIWGF